MHEAESYTPCSVILCARAKMSKTCVISIVEGQVILRAFYMYIQTRAIIHHLCMYAYTGIAYLFQKFFHSIHRTAFTSGLLNGFLI